MLWSKKDIADDRGQTTVLYIDRKPCPRPDQLDKQRAKRLTAALLSAMMGRYWWRGIAALAIFLAGALILPWVTWPIQSFLLDRGLPTYHAGFISGGVYGLLVLPIFAVFHNKQRRPMTARLILRDHICPSCLYDLQGLTPADDDCTVCPECGSAWRIDAN
jgi:hypothetical protein